MNRELLDIQVEKTGLLRYVFPERGRVYTKQEIKKIVTKAKREIRKDFPGQKYNFGISVLTKNDESNQDKKNKTIWNSTEMRGMNDATVIPDTYNKSVRAFNIYFVPVN